jgi:hypothetical protein
MPDSYIKAVTEELAGAISSQAILTIIGLTAGGAAMLGEPITGCVLLTVSVFYGTLLKVKAGRMFESSAEPIADESHAVIKTKSGRFSLVRLLSKDNNKIKPL